MTDDPSVVPAASRSCAIPDTAGAAVAEGLTRVDGHALVVNADLPAATYGRSLPAGRCRTRARGSCRRTTNALSLPNASVFAPLYGPGSADRFRPTRRSPPSSSPSSSSTSTRSRISSASRLLRSGHGRVRFSPYRREGRPALRRGGGARFARGLDEVLKPGELTVVGNVGDDVEILGLHVSPDLDSLVYTLGGLIDDERAWGEQTKPGTPSSRRRASVARGLVSAR